MGRKAKTRHAKILQTLGYDLRQWRTDAMGNKRKYATFPISGSGSINYFDSLKQVFAYIDQVIEIRDMQELSDEEWNERVYGRIMEVLP